MEREEQQNEGLQKFAAVAGRRWRAALVCFLVVVATTFTIVWALPDLFESSATVLIESQQIPDELVQSTVTSALETRLQTINQEIFSRARLEGLIERFDLYREMKLEHPIEAILERMRGDISLELKGTGQRNNRTTVAFTVSYKGSDPTKVAAVTNTLASFYIEENLKVRGEQSSATSEFFRIQLEEARQELEEIERRLSEFKRAHVGELPHQQESNLGTIEQLNARLRLNSDKQMRTSELVNALQAQIAQAATPLGGPDATATRIEELRGTLRELRKSYSDQYPDVIRVKAEIAALVEQLAQESAATETSPPPDTPQVAELRKQLLEAETELAALRHEAEQIDQAMAQYEQRLDRAPLAEQQFQVLTRNYENTNELYRSLLLRQKEADLADRMEQRQKGEQFRIIDPAYPSQVPAAPNRPVLWAIAALAGLGLAVGLALLLEQLDSSYHSTDELRGGTSVPILVSIPRIVTRRDRRRDVLKFLLKSATTCAALAVLVAAGYWLASGNEILASLLMR